MPARTDDTDANGRATDRRSSGDPADSSLELLGPGSFAPVTGHSDETVERRPSRFPTVLAVLAVAAVVIAFVALSRPSEPAPEGSSDAPTGVDPTNSVPAGDESGPTERDVVADRLALRDIPPFDSNVPDLPGVLSGIDTDGSFVIIDRTEPKPTESALGPAVVGRDEQPVAWLGITGAPLIALDGEISLAGTELLSDASGVRRNLDLGVVVPGAEGSVLVVNQHLTGVSAVSVALDGSAEAVTWELASPAIEVLGQWAGSLLVRQGTHTWLLAPDGTSQPVTNEQVLTFDGRHLVVLACGGVGECRLIVGPPDDLERRSIVLPEDLRRLAPEAWIGSLAISPDGSRLAASVNHGALSLPMVIDLETGDTRSLADGMNRQAPVVWSPDGRWLAYVYTDDVMVWPSTGERSWRITLDRQIDVLVWR
jgi:hypothetical protein